MNFEAESASRIPIQLHVEIGKFRRSIDRQSVRHLLRFLIRTPELSNEDKRLVTCNPVYRNLEPTEPGFYVGYGAMAIKYNQPVIMVDTAESAVTEPAMAVLRKR